MPLQAILGGIGKVTNFLKTNPWVGTAVKYGVERRDMNRAHRRQMTDLKRAGINPILSAKLGGANTPTMEGLGQVQNTARQIDQTENLTDAQVQKIEKEIENLIATEQLTYTQARNVRELTTQIEQQNIGLVYDNVYKHIIANHQQNNPKLTIGKYYGTTVAKLTDTILKGRK